MLQPTIAGSMDTQWIHLNPKPCVAPSNHDLLYENFMDTLWELMGI